MELCLALDLKNLSENLSLARQWAQDHRVTWVKLGPGLLLGNSEKLIGELKDLNYRLFFDVKLHDIADTVARAVIQCARLGADLVTVHSTCGEEGFRAAVAEANTHQMKIAAIIGLTSITPDQGLFRLHEEALREAVCQWGTHALVTPGDILETWGKKIFTVVPGVRLPHQSTQEQKRVITPRKAQELGAGLLVLGRGFRENPENFFKDLST